jgi:hypothetical protein
MKANGTTAVVDEHQRSGTRIYWGPLVDSAVPCTFDFDLAATKYFPALGSGEIPLCVMFSGTVFYQSEDGALQIAHVP